MLTNQRRCVLTNDGVEIASCALGSVSLEECFRYVCDEYEKIQQELAYLAHMRQVGASGVYIYICARSSGSAIYCIQKYLE